MDNIEMKMPNIKIRRMGKYAVLYVDDAMIELKDFQVIQSMNGSSRVTVSFDVPMDVSETNLNDIPELLKCGQAADPFENIVCAFSGILEDLPKLK